MARNIGPHTITCYHCRHAFEVGGRTQSTSCPNCNKPVYVADIVVKGGKIRGPMSEERTCGRIVVKKRGRLMARHLEAHGGIDCEGAIEASDVVSGDTVNLGPKSNFHGNLTAPACTMDAGARVKHSYFNISGAGPPEASEV